MPTIQDTIYPRLKSKYSKTNLDQLFTLTDKEMKFILTSSRKSPKIVQSCFAILYKVFSHVGYFIPLHEISKDIIKYIAQQFHVEIISSDLLKYHVSTSKTRHISFIRKELSIQYDQKYILKVISMSALKSSQKKDNIADIINDVIEELIKQYCELPGFTTLERSVRLARNNVNKALIQRINNQLTDQQRKLLDNLLNIEEGEFISKWAELKMDLQKPTDSNLKNYIKNHLYVKEIADQLPSLDDISSLKIDRFYEESLALDKTDLLQKSLYKRYTFMTIFLKNKVKKSVDELIEVYIKIINKVFRKAQKEVDQYYLEHVKTTDYLIDNYEKALSALAIGDDEALLELKKNNESNLTLCRKHIAATKSNVYYYLLPIYKRKRSLIFDCISLLDIRSTTADQSLINCLKFIKEHRNKKREWIIDQMPLDLNWINEEARTLITDSTNKQKPIVKLHRNYLEIVLFHELSKSLKSLDLYVKGSFEYEDYRDQLIDNEEYENEIDLYNERLEFPKGKEEFIVKLKEELTHSIQNTDRNFADNRYITFENEQLVIRKSEKRERHPDYKKVDQRLKKELKQISILDILTSVNKSVVFSENIGLHSGNDPKIDNYDQHLLSTLFSYGCNLGPAQAEKSLKFITQNQLSWFNRMHVTETKLSSENTKIINKFNQLELPSFWGQKESVSVDGTHWNIFSENSFSEYHIRYGKYGGIGYYHVSDTYIALFSHFIPCGVYEAVFVLDGIINNTSSIQPNKIHGDTHAQNEAIFGLSYLLGIQLMPRIRSLKELNFYKPEKDFEIENLDTLFTKTINWSLIQRHYDDMFKVTISIMEGKITASHIIKKLTRKSRRNKLYLAFKELGKVVRTKFLMEYLDSLELRKQIHQGTVKSEEFNHFTKWVSFGSNSTIRENRRYEQLKIIKYNHLVTNAIILYNTYQMSKILDKMIKDGSLETNDVFKELSPYRTEHINRFGEYHLNMKFPALYI
ncbi:Tn3 family transposase [Flammeovirga aprica]|uniref:Tn3 family transposase n=1 Tax=Flammeovirga aprica JL-4 TaxID=694437 RepID=A0A7X9XDJ5_9BACT|nr:Tn3 family transposase [Flammeovirga aprica]NME72865.1 Tn3 family transposase [Flammeovirga aprica JL-4]